MEELDRIRNSEDSNYETSKRVLGDSVGLVEDLLGLYSKLSEMIRGSGLGPRDELVCAGQFLLGCRYQLTLGALAALRGHLNDSSDVSVPLLPGEELGSIGARADLLLGRRYALRNPQTIRRGLC